MSDPSDPSRYPVEVDLDAPLEVANWRPLVHWLLVLPQALVAGVLSNVAGLLAVISWFVILFTGRLPEGIAAFQCMVVRYQTRVASYALWMRESYPPFEFDLVAGDPGTDPVRVDVRPQLADRNRLTVGLRFLWIIPVAIALAVLGVVAWVIGLAGFVAVLFTGRWPAGLRHVLVGIARFAIRVHAYAYLLVDDYPPLSLDAPPPD